MIMAKIMEPEPGMEVYDPCCGSGGLLIKCQIVLNEQMNLRSRKNYAPLKIYGQENLPDVWAMANMNMIIHDMEGVIEIGDTFKHPQFKVKNGLQTFDRVLPIRCGIRTGLPKRITMPTSSDVFQRGGLPGKIQRRLGLGAAHTRQSEQ